MENITQNPPTNNKKITFGNPPEIINCFACHHETELDGYLFKLVPVCADCRTERELEVLSNRIERRRK